MQYMITFNHIDGVWDALSEDDREAHGRVMAQFVEDLWEKKQSRMVFMSPTEQRKTVRKHPDGKLETIDGPAIPGPEQVGGYFLIECESIDEAVEWAENARWLTGSNEVRALFTLST